jgi:hypothetical protein
MTRASPVQAFYSRLQLRSAVSLKARVYDRGEDAGHGTSQIKAGRQTRAASCSRGRVRMSALSSYRLPGVPHRPVDRNRPPGARSSNREGGGTTGSAGSMLGAVRPQGRSNGHVAPFAIWGALSVGCETAEPVADRKPRTRRDRARQLSRDEPEVADGPGERTRRARPLHQEPRENVEPDNQRCRACACAVSRSHCDTETWLSRY